MRACVRVCVYICMYIYIYIYSRTHPDAGYPDRLVSSGKFVENSTKLTCLEITGFRIEYSTVLWLLELKNQVWSKG